LVCEQLGLDLARAGAELDVTADRQFDGGEGTMSLAAGPLRFGANAIRSAKGEARVTYRKDALVAHYQVGAEGLASPLAGLSALAIDGSARSTGGLGRFDLQADLDGEGLAMGRSFESSLASMARSGEGTLVQPVLDRIRASLSRESRGSRLSGSFILRQSPDGTSLVVPQAAMKGGSGKSLLSLSRLKIALASKDGPRVTGNFAIGGAGLPVISGRMEGAPGARLALNIRMPEYRAGTASLALPRLVMVQRPGGALGFSGEARLSGAIPGGRVDGLVVPLEGNWSGRSGIALWRKCVELRFDRLEMADLGLVSSSLPVCPSRSGAIVQSGAQGIRVIAGLPGMELVGSLGSSPIRITSGPAAVAWPGKITVRDVSVALGSPFYVSNFLIGKLDGQLGSVLTGRFEDSDVLLDAVPLDVLDAAGAWQFADGVLTLAEGSFRLEDREQVDRFQPLVARDAVLRLADNVITAQARLREPQSLREIVRSDLVHDLTTGVGSADLFADGIRFDGQL
ncbi:MAG: C4-dicarboxylate ABC transporter, partial [Novosphingobium sp.]|nr:C4-dicarboxylate ABC transporter [Novosphingobium sp.]